MRRLTIIEFAEELDALQLECLRLSGAIHEKFDQREMRKLLEGQLYGIKQVAFGVLPSLTHPSGHIHYALKMTLIVKENVSKAELLQYMMTPDKDQEGTVITQPCPFSLDVDEVVVYDSCKEYRDLSGFEVIRMRLKNSVPYEDN